MLYISKNGRISKLSFTDSIRFRKKTYCNIL